MATKISTYIANLGKSVAYAAVDKMGKMAPTTSDLVQTNSELFKEVTHNIINYKTTYKRGLSYIKNSKIYEAAETGINSIFEDLQTGKFWNKERIDQITIKNMGFDGFDDDVNMNFDSDEDFGDFDSSDDISKGDELITNMIAETSYQNASMISNTIAKSSKYIAESQKTGTHILYTQNMQAYNLFNKNLSAINDNISKVLTFQTTTLQTHAENSKKYYEKTTELMEKQTALLQQIAEKILTPSEQKKESNRITYDDIMKGDVPDIKMYMKNIKKNFGNTLGSLASINSIMGEDSNMLEIFAASPLQFIPTYIVNRMIPKSLDKTISNFDKSLKGFFGSMIAKLNSMKSSDNMLLSKIGEIFGISNSAKSSLDTKNYNKGKVDWDGKSRKALIEIIPSYLSKILSVLSGKAERIFDYDEGKFVDAKEVKDNFKKEKKKYVNNASSEVMDKIDEYMKYITFNTIEEQKRLRDDIDKILQGIYNKGGFFDINSKKEDEHVEYGVDAKSMAIFKTMFKNMERSIQLSLGANIVEQRERQTKDMKAKEELGDSVYHSIFNGFNAGEFVDKKGNPILGNNNLLKVVDNKGHNIFYYLQNIWKELVYIKRGSGMGPGSNIGNQIIYGDTIATIQDEFEIPDNKKDDSATKERQQAEKMQKNFEQERDKLLSKDKTIVNLSEINDIRDISRRLGGKIELENNKAKLQNEIDKKKSLIDKLLEAESLSAKTKTVIESLNNIAQKPMKFIVDVINKADQRMYDLVFGKSKYKGQDINGIFGIIKLELTTQFGKLNSFIDDKILNPIKNKLQIENMKDLGKKIFGMFGLDLDEIKESIRRRLFDENDGILTSIKNGIKDVFKNAWEISKNALKDAYGPLLDKAKSKIRGSSADKMIKELEELDSGELDFGNISSGSDIINIINKATNAQREKEYINMFDNPLKYVKDENKKKVILEGWVKGISKDFDPEKEKQNILEEEKRLERLLDDLTKPGKKINENRKKHYEISEKALKDRKKVFRSYEINKNILQSLTNKEEKDNYMEFINYQKEEYTKGLDKLIKFDDTEKQLLENMFTKLVYGKNFDRLKYNKLIELSADLAKKDPKYKSINKKLIQYASMFDDSSKLTIDDIIDNDRAFITPQGKTAADFINSAFVTENVESRYKYSESINKIIDGLKSTTDTIKEKVIGIYDLLKSALTPKKEISSSIQKVSSLDSWIVNNPEGKATLDFAQDLTNVIANWMAKNVPHHEQGGVIEKPQVATLNKGEVVLTPENVETLLSILNQIESDAKSGASAKEIGTRSQYKVASLVKNANISDNEDFSKFIDYSVEDPKVLSKLQALQTNKLYNKVFNIFNINLQKALEDYTRKKQQLDEKGIPTDPVQRAMYNESEPFAKQVIDELYAGTTKVKDALFGNNPNRDKKKFGEAVDDVVKNITKYAPEAIGAGLLGAGVSFITGAIGGPLLGAAVGAGISLTKNSEKIQNWLFGEFDTETHERPGGVIPKKYIDKISKLVPDLKTYGIAGGLTGLLPIVPFGPVGGLMIGSGIAFAKNSAKVQDFLFGEKNGLFKPETKEKIEKALPRMGAGAVVGIMAGPFGLLGNAAVGAAAGMLSTTDTFNKFIFGTKDPKTGEYENGLLPSIRHVIIDPLKSFMHVTTTRIQDFINDKILEPLKGAFDPIKKDIKLLFEGMFNKIGDFINNMFEKLLGIPLNKLIEDKLLKRLRGFFGKMFKAITFIPKKIITAPFSAIGALGKSRRKAHIRSGNADYMTAQERINFRKTNKVGGLFKKDKFADFDEMLVNMTDEDKHELYDTLDILANNDKNLNKRKSEITSSIGSRLSKYLSYDDSKAAMKELTEKGNVNYAKELIDKQNQNNRNITEKRQKLIKTLSNAWNDKSMSVSERSKLLRDNVKQVHDLFGEKGKGNYATARKVEKLIAEGKFDEVNKIINDFKEKDDKNAFDLMRFIDENSNKLNMTNKMINDSRGTTLELQKKLKNIPELKDLDLTDKRNIKKYMNLIKKEFGVNPELDENAVPEQVVALEMKQKHHKEIIDMFKDALNLLEKISNKDINADNTEEFKRKSAKNAYKKTYGKSNSNKKKVDQDRIEKLKLDTFNKRYEEIQNANVPPEVKEIMLNDLMKLKSKKATSKNISRIKNLPSVDEYVNRFRSDLRDEYNINEEDLKKDEKHKPFFDKLSREKEESEKAKEAGVDSNNIQNFAAGGLVTKTGLATVSRGEYVSTPNVVNEVMQTVPTLLKNMTKSEDDNRKIFQKILDKVSAILKINKNKDSVVEKIDESGNVMKFYRNSRKDLVADMGDTGTRKAIEEAKERKEENKNIFARFGDMFRGFLDKINPFSKNKDGEDDDSFISKILKKGKTIAAIAAGVAFLPKIIEVVGPIVKDLWDNKIVPFLKNTVAPWITNTLVPFLADSLGGVLSFAIKDLLPSLVGGLGTTVSAIMNTEWGYDNQKIGDTLKEAVVRDTFQGGRGIKAVGKLISKSKPKTIKGKLLKTGGKFGTKIIEKGQNLVNRGLSKIDNIGYSKGKGIKALSEKAAAKTGGFVTRVGDDIIEGGSKLATKAKGGIKKGASKVASAVVNAADSSGAKGIIGKIGKKCIELVDNILNSKIVKKLMGNKKFAGKTLCKPIIEFLERNVAKLAAKVSAKTAAAVSTGGIINAAFAIADFISGWNNAENIIGITGNATIGMKLAAGLIKAINGFVLFGLIPENLLVDLLLPVFGKLVDKDGSIQKQREQAKEEVARYNAEHGTNYTVAEYNKKVLGKTGFFGKIKNGIVGIGQKIGEGAGWVADKFKKGAGWVADKAKGAAGWVADKAKGAAGWVADKAKGAAGWVKDKVSGIGEKVSGFASGAKEKVTNLASNIKNKAKGLFNWVTGKGDDDEEENKIIKSIKNKATSFWNQTSQKFSQTFSNLKGGITKAANSIDKKLGSMLGLVDDNGNPIGLTDKIGGTFKNFTKGISDKLSNLKSMASETFGKISDAAKKKFDSFKENIGKGLTAVDEKLGSILGLEDDNGNPISLTEMVKQKGIVQSVKTVASNVKNKAVDAIKGGWNKIKSFFGGNGEGDKAARIIGGGFGSNDDNKPPSTSSWNQISQKFSQTFSNLKGGITKAASSVDKKLGSMLGLVDDNGNPIGLTDSDTFKNFTKSISDKLSNPLAIHDIVNGMIYYSQSDKRWQDVPYGSGTIGSSGCGPTAAAMVLSSLTKQNITPIDTAKFSIANGFRVPAGTDWAFFNAVGKQYGVDIQQNGNKDDILKALRNKQPVIFTGRGSAPFTQGGHFAVGTGLNGSNIKINDPVSMERSKQYSSQQIFRDMDSAFIANKSLDPMQDRRRDGSLINTSSYSSSFDSNESPSIFNLISELGNVLNFSFDRLFGFDPNSESGTAEPTLDNSYGPVAISTPSGSLVSDNLVNFIKVKEGFRAELYEDSGGVPTIGFGTTSGPLLQKGIVTEEEATAALLEEINQKALEVKNQLDADGITLSQNEFDALVSFAYNAGSNALINKTQIYSKIKEGLRGEELRPYFNTYIKDNKGNVLEGLITRRKEEASIFIDGKAAGYASGGNGLKAPAHIENTPSGGILTRAKSNSAKPNIMGGFGLDSKALRQSLGSGFGKADNEMRKYRTTNTNVMGGNGKTISSKVSKTTKASNNNILPYKSDSSLTNVSANNSVTIELIKSIINVLIKISSNTDNLQKIVELLANVLDVKIPKEQIQNVKTSTGKQDLTNLLSSSVNNNTIDNSSLLQILNALASE